MTALSDLIHRRDGIKDWLDANAPYCQSEQAHCVEGTRERAYWHHGYMMALRDVLNHPALKAREAAR